MILFIITIYRAIAFELEYIPNSKLSPEKRSLSSMVFCQDTNSLYVFGGLSINGFSNNFSCSYTSLFLD